MTTLYRWVLRVGGFGLIVLVLIRSTFGEGGVVPAFAAPLGSPVIPSQRVFAPIMAPAPSVTLNAPSSVQIGADFTFTVTFDNTSSVDTGYGPFIDLYFPVNGIDGAATAPQDGIDFISATYLGSALGSSNVQVLTFGPTGQLNHPFLRSANGAAHIIQGSAGDKLVVVQLPFGSFVPGQPAVPITVNARLSSLADLNAPLTLHARGGFRYGASPLDDWCCDVPVLSDSRPNAGVWSPSASITPNLITVAKTYSFAENETATGPNYPRTYTIQVDVPDQQTITNLVITDYLPDNAAFLSVDSITPAGSVTTLPPTGIPANNNQLVVSIPSVTGGPGDDDVTITYSFFISRTNASGAPILPEATGIMAASENRVKAVGDWTPVDTRDTGSAGNAVANGPCPTCAPAHTLYGKSIAIQKTSVIVNNVGPSGYTPGDTLEYTLNFQISDFFAFGNVVITDIISDGQHFDPSFRPTLEINGNGYLSTASGMADASFTVAQDFTGAVENLPVYTLVAPPHTGSSNISFRVSDEIANERGQANGWLIGGCVPANGTGGGAPDCASYNNGATTGRIVFRTVIQDQFTDHFTPNDPAIDHGDIIKNHVTIGGDILSVSDPNITTGNLQIDASNTQAAIAFGELSKSIYAVNGAVCASQPCANVKVSVGQTLTYRIRYTLPTSDFEKLVFTDLLPRPVFNAADPDADGTPGPNWTLDDEVSTAAPAAGHIKFGPADSFRSVAGENGLFCSGGNNQPVPPGTADGTPCITANATDNSIRIDYGSFNDPANRDTAIDLLLTAQVTSQPFTDGLFLTNQVSASEGTTNAGDQTLTSIVPFTVNSPYLITTKSAVASDNLNAVISAPLPVVFNAPGVSGLPWAAPLNSEMLAATPINSDISNVNAGDLVRFAIVIENQGNGLNGAFDVTIRDSLPAGYVIPTGGINLQVLRGDGSPVAFTGLGGGTPDFFYGGIRLNDPGATGACEAHSLTSGRNIVLITYDLQVAPDAIPDQQIQNISSLTSYRSQPGGENFLAGGPLTDTALTTIPTTTITKDLVGTEIENSDNDNDQVVIGEKITYSVAVTLPQGAVPSAEIVDTLDDGLAFVGVQSVVYSNGVSASTPVGTGPSPANVTVADTSGGTGNQVTFQFGTLTNADRDNTVADTVTITYEAVVVNITDNRGGTQLNNSAVFHWTSKDISNNDVPSHTQAASAPVVTVIEPRVTVAKTATPTSGLDALDPLTYTITLTGAVTDAFDVTLNDPLPALFTNPVINAVSASGTTAQLSDFQITGCPGACVLQTAPAAVLNLPVGASITIDLSGTLGLGIPPSGGVSNTATAQWTSLSGMPGARSTYSPDSVERTGVDGSGAAQRNNYAGQSTAVVITSNPILLTKSIAATSEASTADANVAVGEIIRYRLTGQIPEGTMDNLQLGDMLPTGLTFIDDNTARVSFICDGAASPCLTSSTLDGPGLVVNGSAVAAAPTFSLPATSISNNASSSVRTFTNGTPVWFSLGSVVNRDNDPNNEFVVVEFNALVNNLASNINNTALPNSFVAYVNGAPSGSPSTPVSVTVREPQMSISKSVTPNSGLDFGDTVTYSVTFGNAVTASADAFDARLTDSPPATLTLNPASLVVLYTPACGTPTASNATTASIVDVTVDRLTPGCSVTFIFTAALRIDVTPNQTIVNTGRLVYTSLPGANGTTANATGSANTGSAGTASGERDGSGGINNYRGSSGVNLTTKNIGRVKNLTGTELNNPGNNATTQATIGELIDYQLVITVPEGTTPNLTLQDTLDSGLALAGDCAVGLPYSITISDPVHVTTSLSAWPSACPSTTAGSNPLVSAPGAAASDSGRRITWNLGTVTNSDTDNATAETITISFRAVVLNLNTGAYNNQNSPATNRRNRLVVSYGPTTLSAVYSNYIAVVEPVVNTAKSVSAGPYNAGDMVTYTVTLTNPPTNANPVLGSTTAYNVTLSDPLPSALLAPAVSSVSGGGFTPADFTLTGCPAACVLQTASSELELPANTTVTIQVTGTLAYTVSPGQVIINTAATRWTSLPGAPGVRSTYAPTAVERDGSGGLLGGGNLNDYRTNGGVNLTISNVAPAKSIVQSSETTTSGENAATGEIVRYHLAVQIPQGTSPSFQVQDTLPAGLTFLNDGTARVALVCNGPAPCLTAATLGAPAGLLLSGSDGSPTPTVAFPDAAVSRVASGNDDAYTPADPVFFTLGDVVNNDNDVDAEYVVIEFNALVNNLPGNSAGVTRANRFIVLVSGSQNGLPSNDATITLVEPALSLAKTATPLDPTIGAMVSYTLDLGHIAASSSAAFDVLVTDTLVQDPPAVTLNLGSISATAVPAGCASGLSTAGSSGRAVEVRADQLPLGCAITVTYNAQVGGVGQISPADELDNNVTTTWTSLPASGTPANSTGSATPGASGALDGERNGSGGTNTYTAAAAASVTVTGPDLILQKSDGGALPAAGEILTYTLSYDNVGNAPADNVILSEIVPANTMYEPAANTTPWTCTGTGQAGATCVYSVGGLAPGASGSLTFAVRIHSIIPVGVSTIDNTSSITDDGAHGLEATPSNNTSSTQTPVAAAPDLRVIKIPGAPAVGPGDTLIYTLLYDNIGSRDAVDVQIVETVPTGARFIAASSSSGWSCADNAPAGTTCVLDIAQINAGAVPQTALFAVRVELPFPAAPRQLHNAVDIHDNGMNGTDPNTGNNHAETTTPVSTSVDLELLKTDSGARPRPGDTLVYTLTYRNLGNQSVTGVVITETVPAHTRFTRTGSDPRWSCAEGALAGTTCTLNAGALPGLSGDRTAAFAVIVDQPLPAGVTALANTTSIDDDHNNGGEANPGNNTAQTNTPLDTHPNLGVEKSDGGVTAAAGVSVSYTLTYNNTGDIAATNVTLTETVPANTIFNPAISDGRWNCASYTAGSTCTLNLGTVAAGGVDQSVLFAVTVDSPLPAGVTEISNTAAIDDDHSHGADADASNNASSDQTPVTGAPYLMVEKTDNGAAPVPGDVINYTITYRNTGTRGASGVILTETIPAHATFNAGLSHPSWNCPAVTAGTSCTLSVGVLPVGGPDQSAAFAVNIDQPLPGGVTQIDNTVSIDDDHSNGIDITNPYTTADTHTPVTAAPDLMIEKTGPLSIIPGGVAVYQLAYRNAGNQAATGVFITETVPQYTIFNTAQSTPGWSCADGGTAGSACTFPVGNLAAGGSASVTFAVTVDAALPAGVTELVNTASIDDDHVNGVDPTPGDNSSTAPTTLTAAPDLSIVKTGPAVITPGSVAVYQEAYANTGDQEATGVIITEIVPQYTTFEATQSTSGWVCASGGTAGSACTFTVGSLAAGAAGVVDFAVTVDAVLPAGVTEIVNTATIDDDHTNGTENTPGNNSSTVHTSVDAAPDLTISKQYTGAILPGGTLTYTIAYTNTGNEGATGVAITETVPAHTRFDPTASAPGWACAGSGEAGETCTFIPGTPAGSLPAGATGNVTFAVTVDAALPSGIAFIHNTVSIQDDGASGSDPTPGDNQDTVDTPLNAAPDLSVVKTDGVDVVAPGTTLVYTLTVRNTGNQTAAGVILTDSLPAGVTIVSASDMGIFDETTRMVTWPSFDLAPAQQIARTVNVTVDNPLPAGVTQLDNVAEVKDDGSNGTDVTPENNISHDIDTFSDADKQLTATDQAFSTLPNVAIGEILTYEVSLTVKPGQLNNLRLVDVLDRGLAFIDCQISGGADLAATPVALSEICASKRTIATEPPGSTNAADAGRKMTLDFGALNNSGAAEQTLTVRYRVAVVDNLENVRGVSLNNHAQWSWTGGALDLSARTVTIIEPELTLIKTADVEKVIPGQIITYTLTAAHDPTSNSPAFDVVLTDVLPAELQYVTGSLRSVSGPTPTSISASTTSTMQVRWAEFPLSSQAAVIQFQARVVSSSGGITIQNTAVMAWTSIFGDRSQPTSGHNGQTTERNFVPDSDTDTYGVNASVSVTMPDEVSLPKTGFAPNIVTVLSPQPAEKTYQDLGSLWIEIPRLSVKLPITGAPLGVEGWDLTWLGDQAGWLEGTAYPGLEGNSALTAHATLSNGRPGPFARLNTLKWGDVILLHANGQVYRYEVREVQTTTPDDLTPLKHETRSWLTLLTCRGYDAAANTYLSRVAVRAILISVE